MKRKILLTMLIIIVTALSACRSETDETQTADADDSTIAALESSGMDTAYPMEEKQAIDDAAYPITEADRESLMKNWSLVTLAENGTVQNVKPQTLQLNNDGSYTLTNKNNTETGNWSSKLSEAEPSLSLYPESGDSTTFFIIELYPTRLHIRSWQGNTQIDKIYLPAE